MKWVLPCLALLRVVSASIKGVNFFGLETELRDFDCSWANPVDYYMEHINAHGYNHYRIPVSLQYIHEGDFHVLDHFFQLIQTKYPHMNVTLDMHRVFSSHQGPHPLEGGTTLTQFTDGWITLLSRYKDIPQLYGVDAFNEYQEEDVLFWNAMAEGIVSRIEVEFPGRFHYFVGGYRWGGILRGIDLEHLPFADRIGYTIHKYRFSKPKDPDAYEADWEWSFGPYKHKVSVGEWGFFSEKEEDVAWAKRFVAWLTKHGIHDNFFWTSATNSGDTGGLFWQCQWWDNEKHVVVSSLWEQERRRLTYHPTNQTVSPTVIVFSGDRRRLRIGNGTYAVE